MATRARNFMWTLNNYTDEEIEQLKNIPSKYNTWGYEKGINQTPHLQGVTLFNSLVSLKVVIGRMPKRVSKIQIIEHLQEAIDYCHKDGEIYEAGIRPLSQEQKGTCEKERHREINRLAKLGALIEIEEKYPDVWRRDYCKLKLIAKDHMAVPLPLDVVDNEWLFGPTGTGKTRSAFARYPTAYRKAADNHWWDGYQGQEVVIIDDFDKYHVKQGYHLKIWGDHYPFIAETKGGAMSIRPKKIIVTSNYSITEIWDDETTAGPLMRRFKEQLVKEHLYEVIKDFNQFKPSPNINKK